MKKFLLFLIFGSFLANAQITITGDDVNNIFAVGNSTTIKQDTLGSSVDIGAPGGNNVWDFTSLQYNIQGDYTSLDPASTLFIPYFPDATFCMHLEDFSQGFEADTWTYASLNGFFNNFGGALTSSNFPGDFILTLNDPPKQTYINPMTYNSQWSQNYTQEIYFNGTLLNSADATLNVIVDAYGTMTLPGGGSYEALRIRETLTIAGITSVTYSFLSKDGAQVALYAASSNPPSSGVISVDGTSYNTELDGGGTSFVITQPEESEILIAGEVDTIAYENSSGNVDLYYNTDFGLEYVLIDTNYSDPDGIYLWDVPDSLLTTRARIRIVESEDTNSIALSELFKVKPWQLSRIDANDNFELYELDQDGWSFWNSGANQWPSTWWTQFNYSGTDSVTGNSYPNQSPFNNALSSDFPDWPMFVDIFKPFQCYTDFPPLTYCSAATTKWAADKGRWGGSCAGFSVTSIFGFYHKSSLTQYIGSFDELYSQNINDTTRYVINLFQTHQYGKQARDHRRNAINTTNPRILLAQLKEMLGSDNFDARSLDYYNNNGSGGHAVVPYKLERIGNTSTFNIRLYNCNRPGSFNQFIYIDSVANTWSDSTSLNWGTGSSGCFLERESGDFLSVPSLNKPNSINLATSDSPGSSRLEIYNTPDAEMVITSGTGEQIGYQDSIAFNTMSDAVPIIPLTGGFHPPIGYDLPENNYSAHLDNFIDSVSYAIFFTDSTIYNYRRSNAENNETDLFEFTENGIGITNPDQIVKYTNFETIILQDTIAEKVFVATNVQISASDSIHFREKDRNELLFQNYGNSMNYDLQVRYASVNGGINFLHMSIPMAQNSAHQIVPEWTDLNSEPIAILIDLGNDGTIDDTIFVKNQTTNIEDEGSLLSPDSYNLAQNYPNPFNPATSIRYSIAQRSNISLKVYDILGNEVVNLVNEEKDQGVYTVTFNAAGLSSGIYFYTLRADGFVQTKKMLLLK